MTVEKALLVQAIFPGQSHEDAAESLEELARLADTSGAQVVGSVTQELPRPVSATLLGSGKLEFLADTVQGLEADLVVFDNELTPVQNRNIEKVLDVKVLDRTGIILDIFALRARTREGKLQVELAQLSYLLPRLVGRGVMLSRLGGGIGTRGPGETQLEMDRRRVQGRIVSIKRKLKRIRGTRDLHREARKKSGMPVCALVGYTNAGKSTLFRALSGCSVHIEDRLFATLDLTHRCVPLVDNKEAICVDTVGFIQNLPHQLVEAFQATLTEAEDADLLIHVIDASHPRAKEQERAVNRVLEEIGAQDKPCIRVFNKVDLLENGPAGSKEKDVIFTSALQDLGIDELRRAVQDMLVPGRVIGTYRIPMKEGHALAELYQSGRVLRRSDEADAVELDVELDARTAGRFHAYRVNT